MTTFRLAGLLLLLSGLVGCRSYRNVIDPNLVIQTRRGIELGVATDYGIVFLGHTAQAGEIDVTLWYEDGPSTEGSIVEPIGGGLYTAEVDIRTPAAPLSFQSPEPGEPLLLMGRNGSNKFTERVKVASDPHQTGGILLELPRRLDPQPYQVGTGVYRRRKDKLSFLVGLVTGRVRITDADGASRDYLTVMGPEDLWRLVAHRRELNRKPRWVYREDIL